MCMKWILMIISIIDGLNKVENYKKVFGWYLNRRTKVEIYLKTNSNKFTWLIVSFKYLLHICSVPKVIFLQAAEFSLK